MKPMLLKGHERAITCIKFNKDGDLLFTCAKDRSPCVWYTENGNRLGTYEGHKGAVWHLDVNESSTRLLTGSADMSAMLWDVKTGECLHTFKHQTPVRCVGFALGDRQMLTVTDSMRGFTPMVHLFPLSDDLSQQTDTPTLSLMGEEGIKITGALWGPLNETIITSHEDGKVRQWDTATGECLKTIHDHTKSVNSIQFSRDMGMFVTASADFTAKLYDSRTLELLKSYKADRPVNSAALSPSYDTVLLGGGQEAMQVTTTSTRIGKFQCLFFDMTLEDELFRVKGHFGPIHSVVYMNNGQGYASGSEDGYIRLHVFDEEYYKIAPSPATAHLKK